MSYEHKIDYVVGLPELVANYDFQIFHFALKNTIKKEVEFLKAAFIDLNVMSKYR